MGFDRLSSDNWLNAIAALYLGSSHHGNLLALYRLPMAQASRFGPYAAAEIMSRLSGIVAVVLTVKDIVSSRDWLNPIPNSVACRAKLEFSTKFPWTNVHWTWHVSTLI